MNELTLEEIFQKAHKKSHSQKEYWEKVEREWAKQDREDISTEEFVQLVKDYLLPAKQSISNAFQSYFASYCQATLIQCEALKKSNNYSLLLPTVFLLHQTIELFLKMVKIDSFNLGSFGDKDMESIDLLLPVNIKDLSLDSHKVKYLFNDSDVKQWFSCLENGAEQLSRISGLYNKISNLTGFKNMAEETRFPMQKDSYVFVDRSNLSEEKITECTNIITELIIVVSEAYISWHQQDGKELFRKIIGNIENKVEETLNGQT